MEFGSIVGSSPPCANCEIDPVEDKTGQNGDALFCSPECRAEYEGEEPEKPDNEKDWMY